MIYRWRISFEIMPAGGRIGDEHEVDVDAMATNAPDALIAAITFARQAMLPGDGFHMIHFSPAEETDADERVQMPTAWAAEEGRD